MIVVLALVITAVLSSYAKKLDEPVFVKNLVCSSDMDAEVEFITNKKYARYVTDVKIPNMPDELHMDFYDEQVETWSKYDVHIVSFGIGADKLSAQGGLKEDFVFHDLIVKWDDGNETRADIGTIHMTAYDEDYVAESQEGGFTDLDGFQGKNMPIWIDQQIKNVES